MTLRMRADGAVAAGTDRSTIVEPGRTCWRVARAGRVAVIIDAAAYFAAAKAAILRARHSVLLIGWDFDTRIKLAPDDPSPDPGVPDELGPFLNHVAQRRRGPHVFVLKWDLALAKSLFRGSTPLFILDWLTHRRLHFRLAGDHPTGACHHLKIAVIDDAIAFCGGIDMTTDRWDTPDHRDENPRRVRPNGQPYGPFHDVATMVDGEAARALGELARERWRRATGVRLRPPPPAVEDLWPAQIEPVFRDVEVAVARTEPGYDRYPPRREIEALYLAAILSARQTLYLESQYFASAAVADALVRRLAEPDGPEIVLVNPSRAEGWLEEKVMGSARALLLGRLRAADRHHRFRIYTPVTAGGADIYVHAKVVVADDRLLRVGSSNLNNRSMGFDTECDLAIEAREEDETTRRAILERPRLPPVGAPWCHARAPRGSAGTASRLADPDRRGIGAARRNRPHAGAVRGPGAERGRAPPGRVGPLQPGSGRKPGRGHPAGPDGVAHAPTLGSPHGGRGGRRHGPGRRLAVATGPHRLLNAGTRCDGARNYHRRGACRPRSAHRRSHRRIHPR